MKWLRQLRRRRAAHEARRWFVRLHGGSVSDREQRQHLAWMQASPENAKAYVNVLAAWTSVGSVKAAPAAPTYSSAQSPRWAVAATLLAGVLVGALTVGGEFSRPVLYATAVSEVQQIELPDRSRIELAPGSAVTVAMTWRQRNVRLERGEAFFVVAHERWRTFRVDSSRAQVQVHGTQFNVHTGPDGTRVDVAEGVVHVTPQDQNVSSAQRPAELTRGESVSVTDAGALTRLERMDPKLVSSWRNGRLVYRDTPVSTVVADINRYSDRLVVVNDPGIAAMRVTALFRADDPESILAGLGRVLPIKTVPMGSNQLALVSN
jgi:transmembrane sensor